eukprot:Em0015g975a
MALAFALIKQMLKLENRSKEACDFGRDLWIASRAALVQKTMKPLYLKPHRNQLLKGLRPTLELNTFHRWPGVSCSPLPQGLHQMLLPLQLKLKGLALQQPYVKPMQTEKDPVGLPAAHLIVITSPTAIGLMSGAQPGFNLLSAVKDPPRETSQRTFPDTKRKNATSFLNLRGKACFTAEISNAVFELVLSGYNITPKVTTLVKSKDSCALDIRPIAVGETLHRLTVKCLCAVVKAKAAEFFQPHQFGVSCSMGAEKIAHGLRACVDRHWKDEGFSVLKLDMRNAFNVVSRQAFLSECSLHFPELYPWVLWCYGQHPILWHPMGTLTSECGVQQGDPLGPLLFCLVLNILVKDICSDPNCANLSFHNWYLDDGVVAGPSLAVQKVFSPTDVNLFREFCSNYISNKCGSAKLLLHKLEEVGAQDAQVALVLLRLCGSFCKLAHLARATPPSLSIKALELFDFDVRHCFSQCTAVDTSDEAWLQAQLSLSHRARLLSISSPHASSWLSVVPSEGLGLHLNPDQFQVTIKWWLGLDTSGGSLCSLCPDTVLDPLGHHASTCKRGGDAVFRHNRLRDVVAESCRLAHLSVKVEA